MPIQKWYLRANLFTSHFSLSLSSYLTVNLRVLNIVILFSIFSLSFSVSFSFLLHQIVWSSFDIYISSPYCRILIAIKLQSTVVNFERNEKNRPHSENLRNRIFADTITFDNKSNCKWQRQRQRHWKLNRFMCSHFTYSFIFSEFLLLSFRCYSIDLCENGWGWRYF